MGEIIRILLYSILIFVLLWGSRVFFQTSYNDFRVYYEAAINTKLFGNPYLASDPTMSYLYPPVTIILFLPFSFFVVVLAEKMWLVVSLIFFFLALFFIYRLLKISMNSYEGLVYLIFCVVFFPFKFTLGMGQINTLILLFLVLFLYYFEKRKVLAGFFLGLATIIKISPILILLYLFYKKEWDVVNVCLIMILGLGILSFVLFPLPTETYLLSVLPHLFQAWPTDYYNQSITGFLGRLPYPFISLIILRWTMVIAILAAMIGSFRNYFVRREELLHLSSIFPVLLLISSFSWQHHFILLIPSLTILSHFILGSIKDEKKKVILLSLLLLSYLLIGYNIKNPEVIPILLQSHVFYGTLLLWGLHLYVLHQKS